MRPSIFSVVATLSLVLPLAASSSLRQPEHSLTVDGAQASIGVGVGANPEVDAWHEGKKANIEKECDERMKALWGDKRQKLLDLVETLRREADLARANLGSEKVRVTHEHGHLVTEHKHLDAVGDLIDLQPLRDKIAAKEAWMTELDKKIAELAACGDELEKAKEALDIAKQTLKQAGKENEDAKQDHYEQKKETADERHDIPFAREDLVEANQEFMKARYRVLDAENALTKAKNDLETHKKEGSGLADDDGKEGRAADKRSGSRRAAATTFVAVGATVMGFFAGALL